MELTFETTKFAKLCNNQAALNRAYGDQCAKRIRLRLQQLESAPTLEEMVFGRPHELQGDRADQVSLDLVHPLRLIIRPTADPIPRKADGGIDRSKIDAVTVVETADTHD